MEKLVELLNEYETPRSWVVYKSYDDYDWTFYWVDCDWETEVAWSDSYICSKQFWFIKWLVENEKIEYRKIIEKEIEVWFKLVRIKDYPNKIKEEDVEELLMLLSIQDEPIEFLVSILK